ncbi:MAG TPA: carbamoyltransferase HypF [Phycisphaerales bacterium]|nr:carbamoyltransferase HypF [Phycisphaerales bacterium]
MPGSGTICRRRVHIAGQVQGVGFRPFLHHLAASGRLTGFVLNAGGAVRVEVQGSLLAVEEFLRRLRAEAPPLAQIQDVTVDVRPVIAGEKDFEICPSANGELADAQVTPDTAPCEQCLREMQDPRDRRHGYPFINCTHCGPRYTIVRKIPYDRPNTTMADFGMCAFCAGQYADPADRRFHAQPVACPRCGPAVWLVDEKGRQIPCENPIAQTARMLRAGRIVAVKGLGGFHLACRADDEQAVRRLRRRKGRDAKPFAVMVASLEDARALCEVPPEAQSLLTGAVRPIVLLPRRQTAPVAEAMAEGLDTLGVMLPYTPLHHLLFAWDLPPLVMTSGNRSEEPLIKDNEDAVAHLGPIADAILLHNRRIERRLDDSVVQIHQDGHAVPLRRARGFVPRPIHLKHRPRFAPEEAAVLAVGAELKNTVCLCQHGRAVVSEHIGDLKEGRAYRSFIETIHHLESLFEFTPALLAADMHPAYLSTEYALRRHRGELAGRPPLPILRVQHHHAHIAACLAENGWTGAAIGLVCDGSGFGDDGATWGCEVLRADLSGYERLGHLRYLPLPGGDAAAVETWRPALAALVETFGQKQALSLARARLRAPDEKIVAGVEMLSRGLNCPPASSLGRWFDAVAHLAGLSEENRFEGETPMRLEAAAAYSGRDGYPFCLENAGPFRIDLRPMVEAIVADLTGGKGGPYVAGKFQATVVAFLTAAAIRAREETSLNTVALSGGCFANRYLTTRLAAELTAKGFAVLRHREVPCNDGGISLGQAVVAVTAAMSRQAAKASAMQPERT